MSPTRKLYRFGWPLALVIATVLLYASFSRTDISAVWAQIQSARVGLLVVAIVLNLAIVLIWTSQWWVFVPAKKAVGFGRIFEIVSLMAMVANTVPYFAGHVSGVVLLARRTNLSNAAALSVMSLEQLAEGIAKLTVIMLVAIVIPIPMWIRDGLLTLVLLVLLGSLATLVMAHSNREWRDPDPNDVSLSARVRHFAHDWAHHLEALRDVRLAIVGLGLGLAMKVSEAGAILAVQAAFGIDLPMWSALVVLASIGVATMISVAPGNLGVYEATVFVVYRALGVPAETALALAIALHVCYLIPMAGIGYLIVLARSRAIPGFSRIVFGTRSA